MPRLKAPWNERNGRFSPLKAIVFALLFAPAAWIVFQAATGMLDPKPVTEMIHRAGEWAVRLVLLSLLVTPLRRFAQWPKLIAVRRMVGVAAFAYAFAHLSLYVVDQKYDVLHVASEIALRFYLTIGFAAWLGLAALSATSTDAMIRRLGAGALEPSAQVRLCDRGAGDLPLLSPVEARRFPAGADDGLVFHPHARAPVAEARLARVGRRRRFGADRAAGDGVPRGDVVRDRAPYRLLGGPERQFRSRHVAAAEPFRRARRPRLRRRLRRAQLARVRRTSAVLAGAE